MADREVDYLLIGGGQACATAARTLREQDPAGSILLVGREPDPPYERPPCSKEYLQGSMSREESFVEQPAWYAENGIELLTRTSVSALDAAARTAKLSTREEVGFSTALIATGANVRRLQVPGCELEGIHYLRTLSNSDAIRADLAQAEHVVMIGGSYIGCEVAASLTASGRRCTMVMQEQLPLERSFGSASGRFFADQMAVHGVAMHGGDELDRFEGEGRVAKVITKGGRELDAELVVIGAGVAPDVRLASGAGLQIGARGGVRTDERLQTSAAGIFAAGDICEYSSPMHGGDLRVEHWDVAFNHGRVAALNMSGQEVPYDVVPYFFSDLADWVSLEYVGPAFQWDGEIVRGSHEEGAFTTWFVGEGRVRGALAVGRSEDLDHARRLIASGAVLDEVALAALSDTGSDLSALGA